MRTYTLVQGESKLLQQSRSTGKIWDNGSPQPELTLRKVCVFFFFIMTVEDAGTVKQILSSGKLLQRHGFVGFTPSQQLSL